MPKRFHSKNPPWRFVTTVVIMLSTVGILVYNSVIQNRLTAQKMNLLKQQEALINQAERSSIRLSQLAEKNRIITKSSQLLGMIPSTAKPDTLWTKSPATQQVTYAMSLIAHKKFERKVQR